jgi:heptosyltransferase-2
MNHILIIRFSSLGDVVLATAVIDAVQILWPDSRVTFVVKEEFAQAIENNPFVANLIALGPEDRSLRSIVTLSHRLRSEEVDLVIDLQGGPRGRLLAAGVGAGCVVRPRSRRLRRMLMAVRPGQWRRQLPHAVERYLECLSPWTDGGIPSGRPSVYLTPEERAGAFEVVEGIEGTRLVAMAPGARWPSKRWPAEYFAILGTALAENGYGVLLLGSTEEGEVLDDVASGVSPKENVKVLAGNLRLLASAFSVSAAAVCNDSGLMHLATAVGTPTVAIFGPTAPHLGFTPFGDRHKTLWLGLDCSPCSLHGDKACRKAEGELCMNLLEPHHVLAALRELLERAPAEQGAVSKLGGRG